MRTSAAIRPHVASSEPQATALLAGRLERQRLDHLLRLAAAGSSGVLRIIGGGGIGKTTILDYVAERAAGFRVVRVRAVASERELPYAGLHLLCAPLLDEVPGLPPAHRDALGTALGLTDGPKPDRLLLSLATLSLVVGVATAQPLCLVVDDAHCLDQVSAQILAFVARRLDGHAVLLLVAEPDRPLMAELDGLPEMHLQPLPRDDARALLAATAPARIDDMVVERVLAETQGNPRALVEAFDGVTAAELAGGFAIPRGGVPCRIDHDCPDRARRLPAAARLLLLAAAADPTGDCAVLWRVAARLAVGAESLELLEAQNLLVLGNPTVFACPVLRPAVYYSAAPGERRQVHQALADATPTDPVRRSWHQAAAATGFDDSLADDLERCAPRAQFRGGAAARAAFLAKATLLTSDPARRADRALSAAAATQDAGAPDAAERLLAIAASGPDDPARAARTGWHRARNGTVAAGGDTAVRQLFEAARRLEPCDAAAARDAYLESLLAAMSTGRPATGPADGLVAEIARSALAAGAEHGSHAVDRVLYGLATRALDGYRASVAPLTSAITALRDGELDVRATPWLGTAGRIAADLWDSRSWTALTGRHAQLAGADYSATPVDDHASEVFAELNRGRFGAARALVARAGGDRAATDSSRPNPAASLLSAWQGRCRALDALLPLASRPAQAAVALAAAVLLNSLARYDEAANAARDAARLEHLGLTGWALLELVEAAARSGQSGIAQEAAARLTDRTGAAATDWALGAQATAHALLAEGEEAESLYQEAIDRLTRTDMRGQLARAQLLYGEWLRRRNRRVDARIQLHAARDLFATIGAAAFAERAGRELLATGESAHQRTGGGKRQLTPQESRVAYLARDGLSNPEIAAQMYVSSRTVEYHLHKVFAKLAITSRKELHLVLDPPPSAGPAQAAGESFMWQR